MRIITISLILVCCSLAAWVQTTSTTGSLNVSVVDPSGAAIPEATLELRDTATNDVRRGATQNSGVYTFANLPGSTYQLKVSETGFAAQLFESVVVRTSLETDIHVTLKLGATSETITVDDTAAPLIQTESSTLSTSIDTKQVFNLPVV